MLLGFLEIIRLQGLQSFIEDFPGFRRENRPSAEADSSGGVRLGLQIDIDLRLHGDGHRYFLMAGFVSGRFNNDTKLAEILRREDGAAPCGSRLAVGDAAGAEKLDYRGDRNWRTGAVPYVDDDDRVVAADSGLFVDTVLAASRERG